MRGLLTTSKKLSMMLNHFNDSRVAHFSEHIVRLYSSSSFRSERAPMKSFNKSHTSCYVHLQGSQKTCERSGELKHQIVAFIRLPFFAFWLMLKARTNENCDKLTNNNALFREILHLDVCLERRCQRKQHFWRRMPAHDAECNPSINKLRKLASPRMFLLFLHKQFWDYFHKSMQKQHTPRIRAVSNFCQHQKNNRKDPFQRNFVSLDQTITAPPQVQSDFHVSFFLILLCISFGTANQKENKKSIYLSKQPLRESMMTLFLLTRLCCCLFELFMALM